MKDIYVASEQWNGETPAEEIITTISNIFCEKDFNVYLYYKTGSIIKHKSDTEGNDLHIGFYGCVSVNEFDNTQETPNSSHTLSPVTIEFQNCNGEPEVHKVKIDRGTYMGSSLDIKVRQRDNKKDITVARVTYPNTICILLKPSIPVELLKYILQQSMKYIDCSEDLFKRFLRYSAKDNLLKALRAPFDQRRVEKLKEVADLENRIVDLEKEIQRLENKLKITEQELFAISECCDDTGGIAEAISSIEAINKIASVKSSSGCDYLTEGIVKVFTNTIYVRSQRRRYMLGEYEITLDFLNHAVSFKNLSPELRRQSHWGAGCHHPHVSSDGSACLGNIKEDIKGALKEYNFQHAVLLAVSFLKNVNIKDVAGKKIVNWPIVDDEGNIINDSIGELENCHICGKIMPDDEDNELWVKCECCGKYACPAHSEAITIKNRTVSVCSHCHSASLRYCSVCGKIEMVDNMYIKYDFRDDSTGLEPTDDYLCEDCVRSIEIVIPVSDGILAHKNVFVTSEFESRYIKECETCGEKFVSNDEAETKCPYCKNGGTYFTCPDCGAFLPSAEGVSVIIDGQETTVCSTCSEEYTTCMQCLNQVGQDQCSVINEVLGLYICNSCKQALTEEEQNV